jgi:hypothetical protein
VTPRRDGRADGVALFEDERLETPLAQVRGGGEADRPGADDDDGPVGVLDGHADPSVVVGLRRGSTRAPGGVRAARTAPRRRAA